MFKLRFKKYLLISLALVFLVGTLLTGCGAEDDDTVTLGYQTALSHTAAIVAVNQDFFAEEGLNIDAKLFSSGPDVNEAVAAGSVDFGTMGDTPVIMATAGGLPVKVLAGIGGGAERQRLMVRKDSDIESVQDLVGKEVGVRRGTSAHGGFYRLLENEGLADDEISVVDIRPEDMPDSLATEQVDAVLIWEPTPTVIEGEGIGRQIANLVGTGNEYLSFALVNQAFAEQNEEQVLQFMRALDRAVDFIEENPEKTAQIVAEVTGLSEDLAASAVDNHYFRLELDAEIKASLEDTAEFLYENGDISTIPDFDAALDKSYLDKIQ
ncbi:ABC transporter substrate-binding protein [Fuchsiella alkaliacetigena]|uniref:ABC transporter substrate-binding protein n=1 Tax=Fuchsiella alkaliacetigena TaxID=957042 RepID=UPI00200A6B4E|nr:ABC transporter substrate-binding protein [Fuchsiella alkaliacetigena]MCK8823714.1 ABC transporter substrate-binding protein [Fuchsiella alkaliacetigena]